MLTQRRASTLPLVFHGISLFVVPYLLKHHPVGFRTRLGPSNDAMQSIQSSRVYGYTTPYILLQKIKKQKKYKYGASSSMACRKGGAGARRGLQTKQNLG
ncbi:hypothetical protein V8C40DRAFT_257705 [Trichoderma camerunense]